MLMLLVQVWEGRMIGLIIPLQYRIALMRGQSLCKHDQGFVSPLHSISNEDDLLFTSKVEDLVGKKVLEYLTLISNSVSM